jgi:hypothetical protein
MEKLDLLTVLKVETGMANGPAVAASSINAAQRWLFERDVGGLLFDDGVEEVVMRIIASSEIVPQPLFSHWL